ncbi:MAG: molybdopterin-guanine dinucleotide biosynthesis protein B [Candidatus Thorarchaeota archaeon]
MPTILLPPIISVLGYKDSGKTTVITNIINHLSHQKKRILSAKHVGEPAFTLDSPGTDSYRHIESGALATVLHSETTTTLLLKNPPSTLQALIHLGVSAVPVDVVVLEGFRFWTQKHPQIAKIICIRSQEEITEFTNKTIAPIIGQCTLNPKLESMIQIPNEMNRLLKAIDAWLLTAPTITIGEKNDNG